LDFTKLNNSPDDCAKARQKRCHYFSELLHCRPFHLISIICILLPGFPFFCSGAEPTSFQSKTDKRTSIGYYQGQAVSNNFGDLLTEPWKPIDSYVKVLFLAYELDGRIRGLTFDVEGQIVKHEGLQDHWETNVLLVVREHFLEDFFPANAAYGQGLSYALEKPELDQDADADPTQLLHYFFIEFSFDLPNVSYHPQLIFRIHHRSGVFGMYCGNRCGSNIPVVGFRISI